MYALLATCIFLKEYRLVGCYTVLELTFRRDVSYPFLRILHRVLVTANVSSAQIIVTPIMEAINSPKRRFYKSHTA
jgi:hypothetical protein